MPDKIHDQTHRMLCLLAVFVAVMAVYLWSMPKTVVLEDDGTFILAAYFNGIAHPPGYPLYTLLAHLATYVPVGSVATRVHAFSALLASSACLLLWLLAYRLLRSRLLATTVSLVYGFSTAFWSQAIIAEVYALNVFLFLLLILLCLQFRDNPDTKWLFVLICLVYGLALSNHWPLVLLSSPLLLALVWPVIRKIIPHMPAGIVCLLAGLLPYLWMVINSRTDPLVSFYGPLESFSDFIFMVSREGYKTIDTASSADWTDKLQYMEFLLQELYRQFRPFGILFVLIGFVRQWRVWPINVATGLLLGFTGSTFVLIALLGFDFDIAHKNLFRVYPLIAYAIAALWAGLGISTVIDWLARKYGMHIRRQTAAGLVSILLVLSVLISNIPENFRAHDYMARNYAQTILNSLDSKAIFFTYADIDTGPLGYMHLIEGERPDVTLYNSQGLIFANRLFHPFKSTRSERKKHVRKFIDNTERPVYFSTTLPVDYGFEDYGLYARINPTISPEQRNIVLSPEIVGFLEKEFSNGEPYDHWENMLYRLLESEYCRITASQLLFRQHAGAEDFNPEILTSVCRGFYGGTELIELMLNRDNPDWDFLLELLHATEARRDEAIRMEDSVSIYNLWGKYYQRRKQPEKARELWEKSIAAWPDPGNRAFSLIKELN